MQSTIILRLDPHTRHNLEQVSRVTGIARADLVAEAVRDYVNARVEALVAQGLLVAVEAPEEGSSTAQEGWNLIV